MVEYQQALHAVRDILNRFPEVKQLIKLELNSQGSHEYVEYYENSKNPQPQNDGTVSTNSTESFGEVSHESGSGNVPTGKSDLEGDSSPYDDVQSTASS